MYGTLNKKNCWFVLFHANGERKCWLSPTCWQRLFILKRVFHILNWSTKTNTCYCVVRLQKKVIEFVHPSFRMWMPSPMISNPQEISAHKTTSNLALSNRKERQKKWDFIGLNEMSCKPDDACAPILLNLGKSPSVIYNSFCQVAQRSINEKEMRHS